MAERRVASPDVGEALDVVKHIGLGLVARPVGLTRCPLGLQRREEALHRGIVPTSIASLSHPAMDTG